MRAGARLGVLPDFLVIGAMKAGTTSLYHYLDAHPHVFMSRVKELDFFVEGGNWGRGIDWYRRQFAGADGFTAVGEASTAYSKHPVVAGVPERIARSLPGCRLVYIVRDPIERIVSHYRHRWANGSERAAIDDAVMRDPVYLACSRYADQIGRYLDHFPRERLLVLTAEDLRRDTVGTMAEVFGFIGVDAEVRPEALVEEHYRAESRVTYPPAVWRLRRAVKHRVPAAKRAKEAVDSSSLMRRLSQWGTSSAADVPAAVSPALRSRLTDELRDDVAALRRYLPEGWHGWGIA